MSDKNPSSSQPGSSGGQDEESKSSPQQEFSAMGTSDGDGKPEPKPSQFSNEQSLRAGANGGSTSDETIGLA